MCVCVYFLFLFAEGPCQQWHTSSNMQAQVLASKYCSLLKEPRAPWENTETLGLYQREYEMTLEWNRFLCHQIRKYLKALMAKCFKNYNLPTVVLRSQLGLCISHY